MNDGMFAPYGDNDDDGTVFRDVFTLALLGFVAIVILVLPHLNPPEEEKEPMVPPGNIIVEIYWPDSIDADVDLWVEAPGDVPVGYSNKGGRIFNLLRDDLGEATDVSNLNYEVSFSRGIPAGEYTINLHLYQKNTSVLPIPVEVIVNVKTDFSAPVIFIFRDTFDLRREGQELTVVRFTLSEEGSLVAGSIHDLPKQLRIVSDVGF